MGLAGRRRCGFFTPTPPEMRDRLSGGAVCATGIIGFDPSEGAADIVGFLFQLLRTVRSWRSRSWDGVPTNSAIKTVISGSSTGAEDDEDDDEEGRMESVGCRPHSTRFVCMRNIR